MEGDSTKEKVAAMAHAALAILIVILVAVFGKGILFALIESFGKYR